MFQYNLLCEWDLDFFKKLNFQNPQFITFAVHNKSGYELYRKDFTLLDNPDYINLTVNKYDVFIESFDDPYKIVMYMFDEKQQWSERYEKII